MPDMPDSQLQELIDRLRDGDGAARGAARRDLVGYAYERLGRLARVIFHQDFSRLSTAHETGSVLDEAAVRLLKALETFQPNTVDDFFRFAALQIRRVLLDMARKSDSVPRSTSLPEELPDSSHDPERIAKWTEFHEKVEELPEEEREVINLCFYLGLTQAEAARRLGIHPREVSRRWASAIRKLPDPEL